MLLFMQLNQITAVISWNINGFGSFSSQKRELYFSQMLIHCGQERKAIYFLYSIKFKTNTPKSGVRETLDEKKTRLKT